MPLKISFTCVLDNLDTLCLCLFVTLLSCDMTVSSWVSLRPGHMPSSFLIEQMNNISG